MDHTIYDSYTDLLNSTSAEYEENNQFNDIPTPLESPAVERVKSKRKKNLSRDEDIILVSTWLNTSKDPAAGNEHKSHTFWGRIYDEFMSSGGSIGCTEKNVKHRWGKINALCGKKFSCVKQIDDRHQSGQMTHGKLIEAKQLYIANYGMTFQLEHCYKLLKHERKWHEAYTSTSQKRGSFVDLDDDAIPLGDNSDLSTTQVRPLGRKASKEQISKKKANLKMGSSTSTMFVTDERWAEKVEIEAQKFDQRNKMIDEAQKSREITIMVGQTLAE